MCIKDDDHLCARRSSLHYSFHEPSGQSKTVPEGAQAELREQGKVLNQEEPMQLGHSRLNPTKRHHCLVSVFGLWQERHIVLQRVRHNQTKFHLLGSRQTFEFNYRAIVLTPDFHSVNKAPTRHHPYLETIQKPSDFFLYFKLLKHCLF